MYVPPKKLRKNSGCVHVQGLTAGHVGHRLRLVKQLGKIVQRIDTTGGAQRSLIEADYALTVEGVLYRVRRWVHRGYMTEGTVRVSFYVNSIVHTSPMDSHALYSAPSINGLPFYTMPYAAWDALEEM